MKGIVFVLTLSLASQAIAENDGGVVRITDIKQADREINVCVYSLKDRNIPGLEGRIKEDILSDATNRGKSKSMERQRAIMLSALRARFKDDLADIYERRGSPGAVAELNAKVQREYGGAIEANEKEFLDGAGAGVFEGARKAAISEQESAIKIRLFPSAAEIENLASSGWPADKTESLTREIGSRSLAETKYHFFLEEVEAQKSLVIADMIAKARSQYEAQEKCVVDATDADLRPYPYLEDMLGFYEARIKSAIGAYEKGEKAPTVIYPPFPSVLRQAENRSKDREKRLFIAYCGNAPLVDSAEKRAMEREILGAIPVFKRSADGFAIFLGRDRSQLWDRAIRGYGNSSQRSQPAFSSRMAGDKKEIEATLESRYLSLIMEIYKEIAERQLKDKFPGLLNPNMALKDDYVSKDRKWEALEKANLDPSVIFDKPFAVSSVPREAMLEETEMTASTKALAVIGPAREVWVFQRGLINQSFGEYGDYYKELIGKDGSLDVQDRTIQNKLVERIIANITDKYKRSPMYNSLYPKVFSFLKEDLRKSIAGDLWGYGKKNAFVMTDIQSIGTGPGGGEPQKPEAPYSDDKAKPVPEDGEPKKKNPPVTAPAEKAGLFDNAGTIGGFFLVGVGSPSLLLIMLIAWRLIRGSIRSRFVSWLYCANCEYKKRFEDEGQDLGGVAARRNAKP
jgi:hypothetical protein